MGTRSGERILRSRDHFSKQVARLVRLALKGGSHREAVGCTLILRTRGQHPFKGRGSRGAVPC